MPKVLVPTDSTLAADIIISIDNVHKSYIMGKEAVPALRGVSIDIKRGEMVCLMGPSGSGKTTLLNITGGLDSPGRGHVVIDGHNIVSMKEEGLARLRLATMGFVFQTFNLLSNFTALENVEFVLSEIRRLDRIVQELFDVTHPRKLNLSPRPITDTIKRAVQSVAGVLEEHSVRVVHD